MFQRLTAVGVAALLTLLALPVFGAEDKQEQGDVTILEFETFNVDDEVVDRFYGALQDAVDGHEEMGVVAAGETNINDLILTLGCGEVTADCLQGLDEYVDGDRLLFGSLEQAEGVYMLSMQMFDFNKGEFVREVEDETVEADKESAVDQLEVVIESFLYGNVGTLEVTAEGVDEAVVFFDGDELGEAPLSAKRLPLGEHAVTLRTPDGKEETEKVVLRRDATERVEFGVEDKKEEDEGLDEPGDDGSKAIASGKSSLPGWLVSGAGAAGLAVGIVGSNMANNSNTEAARMVCGDALCAGASTGDAERLQSDMNSAHTMSVVGYSVAAVGLATGAYLLYDAYSSSPAETKRAQADDSAWSVGLAPSSDGASVGFSLDF